MSIVYFKNISIVNKANQTQANAFIIAMDCNSARFNFTKKNIERVFPNFFHIHCFKVMQFNDSRINASLPALDKRLATSLITFVYLWTYELIKYSKNNELEWSFIFEDDVDFIEPSKVSLSNYINAVQVLMNHSEIRLKHGMFYLGMCGRTDIKDNTSLIIPFSNNTLISQQGCGYCTHAMGLTTKRARELWVDISLHIPIQSGPPDVYLYTHCLHSEKIYTLGSTLNWPPGTNHYGIAFQDRQRFHSQLRP
ncbi:unnamed protein product [Rotaria sp. Silwood1]|nr:unnamed protein product [Rotaria sp. Silwood1]CAF3557560.1 unnamed protein product [Rotaria sp. Silwood1]CAF3725545.1 unnamed protein product [Rotaria sp. Silwood1]CAF4854379.1 unnamed protein product [Rotaria sp. Silwood1]CAF4854993.1 unnamed protein product [Rotaria sp. Silwood1]